MTQNYIYGLLERHKKLIELREGHERMEVSDSELYAFLDNLIGYISALDDPRTLKAE